MASQSSRLSTTHRNEHDLIEKNLRKDWLPTNLLLVHLAREHATTAPLEEFEGNIGLAVWIDWHDAFHGYQVFDDEVLAAYDACAENSGRKDRSDLVSGVRSFREGREKGGDDGKR